MSLRDLIHETREVLEVCYGEDTTISNTGSFVRPLGPMLPPAPSPGYKDAEYVMFAPKRKRLDSKPRRKT